MKSKLKKNIKSFYFLLFSLAFINLPSLYLIYQTKIFTTYTLGKGLILLSFIVVILSMDKLRVLVENKKRFFNLLLFFLIISSFSILKAIDVIFFIKSYHNLLLGFILFLTTYFLVSEEKKLFFIIDKFILNLGFVVLFLELFFVLFTNQFIQILKLFTQTEMLNSYLMNIDRGRLTLELKTEFFLPFFLYQFVTVKDNRKRNIYFITSLLVFFLSIISNFRTKFLMALFTWITFFLSFKTRLHNLKRNLILVIITLFFALSISKKLVGLNILDRFTYDLSFFNSFVEFKEYRLNALKKSIELFFSSPFLGIGLGNFYFYNISDNSYKYSLLRENYKESYNELVKFSPHNIFLEILTGSGFLSFISFLTLILYFFKNDVDCFIKKKDILKPYIISSWVCFIYLFFNPAYSLFSISWFWFIRGLILALSTKNENK